MAKPFESYDFEDASGLVGSKTYPVSTLASSLIGLNPRRPPEAVSANAYFNRDHWQNTEGYIGNLPPSSYPGAATITADIKKRFTSENVIQEVVETHVGGILGREPLWSFLKEEGVPGKKDRKPDDIIGEMVTPWWNEREALDSLQRAAELVAIEGVAIRRLFFPKGRLPENGELTASSLPEALEFIYFENLTADVAGVFTDPDTQKQIGVYLFDEKDETGDVTDNCAELSFLNEDGDTVCRIVKDKGQDDDFGPYRLGGRLLLHEMKRRPLITLQVQSMQRALNAAHTAMLQNVNMAGARERTVTNAQNPKKPRRVQTSAGQVTEVMEPGTYETGGGAVMFLMGYPVYDKDGNVNGYTPANVTIADPAPVDVFVKTRDHYYAAILGQCHQRHVLISGDATASGRSREQARAEFERSLKESKAVVDAAGRWQLETVLRLAAQLTNESEKYLSLRADFNCLIDSGDVDPEKARLVLEMRAPGGPNNQPLISDETARNWVNIDDAAAELARIEEEAPTDAEIAARQPVQDLNAPPNGDDRVVA